MMNSTRLISQSVNVYTYVVDKKLSIYNKHDDVALEIVAVPALGIKNEIEFYIRCRLAYVY